MHLEERHKQETCRILAKIIPTEEVWMYGSRVHGRHFRKTSDPDLCICASEPVSYDIIRQLKDAFTESDLPFFVDVVDWQTIPDWLREKIEKEHKVLIAKENKS